MRLGRSGSVLLALLLVGAVAPPSAPADEGQADEQPADPSGLDDAEAKRRLGILRKRAAEYWRERKKLVVRCPECKGQGKVRMGRTGPFLACPTCNARKVYVEEEPWRACFYDMRTRAFRLQEKILDRVMQALGAARKGKSTPEQVTKYSIKGDELVDATHALVFVEQNKENVARPQRWIWTEDVGEDPTWFVYEAEVDGPWPGEEAKEEPPPEPATPEPVAPRTSPPPSRPPEPTPPTPPPSRPAGPQDRDTLESSKELVKRWGEERDDMLARVVRVELGLAKVEGHEEEVGNAKTFLGDVKGWLEEVKPFYERAKKEVEEEGKGVLLSDRLKINTFHFKMHRRLELVEQMLIALVPDLD